MTNHSIEVEFLVTVFNSILYVPQGSPITMAESFCCIVLYQTGRQNETASGLSDNTRKCLSLTTCMHIPCGRLMNEDMRSNR